MPKNQLIHHINKIKKKKYIISSIDAEKAFNKIHHPFMIKTFSNLEIEEGDFINLIKNSYKKRTVNIILNGEKLEAFLLRLGKRQGCPLSLLVSTSY